MIRLLIVIVNYNSCAPLEKCLLSIQRETALDRMRVVVVDNATREGNPRELASHFPWVQFLYNQENVGFSRACNQGLAACRAESYLLLNPDTEILDRAVEKTLEFLSQTPEAAIVGCQVLNPDGTLQRASRRSIPNLSNSFYQLFGLGKWLPSRSSGGEYNLKHLDPNQTQPVEAVSGSFLMFRHSLLEETGGLDERFFLYGEDLDFCLQSLERGWKNFYFAGARVTHHKGQSSGREIALSTFHFYNAMKLFNDKHYGPRQGRLIKALVHASIEFLYRIKRLQQILLGERNAGSRG